MYFREHVESKNSVTGKAQGSEGQENQEADGPYWGVVAEIHVLETTPAQEHRSQDHQCDENGIDVL